MSDLSFTGKLEACRQNIGSFDGEFYIAVKSTSIFCLPSCKARFPKEKNIEFFDTKEEAMEAGYRGCKRCRSAKYPENDPDWFIDLVEHLKSDLTVKLKSGELESICGKPIATIRRYFQSNYGLTPAQYQRKQILLRAKEKIKGGSDYRDVAFELGYESISGFRDAFLQQFGKNPGEI
jgi:AraC family transcriptional regulator of adaptative response/methylated-DNA-[protein]-cysteine methyltransferase